MRHERTTLTTQDGLALFAQTWLPDGKPEAILIFAHGQAEHSNRYSHFGEALANAGYALHMADLRGHGQSPGKRGHVMRFAEYWTDFQAMLDYAQKLAPDRPQFFGGHSLGGLIALSYALRRTPTGYKGVVVSAPWLRLVFNPPAWKTALGHILSGVIPGLTLGNELNPIWLSHDPDVVAAYAADPLVHGLISTRAYTEITATAAHTLAHAGEWRLPILFLNGKDDPILGCRSAEEFIGGVATEDCRLIIYEDMFHEVFNEIAHKQVFRDVIAWLETHT